ncbi:MAG: amino acid synthesis family protein [Streptosporangiaceae bacterium]|nr:amino acid synthesis family protein [Streptosporangiaceae bacterium]
MADADLPIRKIWTQVEEIRTAAGRPDDGGPLRKVAACAVVTNPLAGGGFAADLSQLVTASSALGTLLGGMARELCGPVESYGKAAIVGVDGEQEHGNGMLTSAFGDAFRAAIGGGAAWISSATKVACAGAVIDVPLAYKDEIWVRSHYDALEVRVPDAPLPREIVVIAAVASRGRLNARLGGMSVADVRRAAGRMV